MIFKKLKIKNIRSYEDAEIIFPKGSVLLSGDIGAGKTSILLSLEFALFGLQPGQKGTSLLKNGKEDGSVELEFEIDGKEISILRTLKRKKTVSQEDAFITIDGKTEEKAVTELKNAILDILHYPQEFAKKTNLLYRFTVYTPQEEMKQIILENPEVRLNTLRHVFGIDKYKRIKENTLIIAAKLRELSRLKQGEISDLDTRKSYIEERKVSLLSISEQIPIIEKQILEILEQKKKQEKETEEIKIKIEEKRKIENEIEKISIILHTKKEQLVRNEKDISIIKQKIDQAEKSFNQTELDKINKSLKTKKDSYELLNKEIIEISAKISSLESKRFEMEQLKNKISGLKVCPTCLQQVSDIHKHSIFGQTEEEISTINTQKINFDNEKQKKEISINSIKKEIEELEKSQNALEIIKIRLQTIEDDRKRLEEIEKTNIILNNDVEMLSSQIKFLRETVSDLKKYETIMQARESEMLEIIKKERISEIKKAEIVKEIELARKDIDRFEKEIEEKEKTKQELMYILELEDWMSNKFLELIGYIEKNVMIRLREEFSKLFNDWFSILVPESFVVRLDEEFTPIIEQQDYQLDYDYLSGGERTAVALAYRLALNQTINSLLSEIKTKGLVILDEPTDGFSQQQLDKMRDVLQELKVDQLILVSHDQKVESFVENIIRLKKDANGSMIIE